MTTLAAKASLRTYITLEKALTQHLMRAWRKKSAPIYEDIATFCRAQQWDKARLKVRDLDMTEVGTENREWIKYALLMTAGFGAKLVTNQSPSFVGVGTFDDTLNQVVATMLMQMEHAGTTQVQKQAMQLIATDEEQHQKVQKQEHQYGTTQITVSPVSSLGQSVLLARQQVFADDLMGQGKDIEGDHITVRYGLQSMTDELRLYLGGLSPFLVQAGKVIAFEPSEHSDGAAPLVVGIESPELHAINAAVEHHASFKESSFSTYVPHCTLAYVKPETATAYERALQVTGSMMVTAITINHEGQSETIPFGWSQKFDKAQPRQPAGAAGSHGGEFAKGQGSGADPDKPRHTDIKRMQKEFKDYLMMLDPAETRDALDDLGSDGPFTGLRMRRVAKERVQQELAGRLRTHPAFTKMNDEDLSAWVRERIDAWAETSGDSSVDSVKMQEAVKKEFELHSPTEHLNAPAYVVSDEEQTQYQAFARAQYDHTQEWFKARGITHVTVMRGMDDKTLGHGQEMVTMQPASAWSFDLDTAHGFGSAGEDPRILVTRVPVSQVLSTAVTGSGCLTEREVILLGRRQRAWIFDGENPETIARLQGVLS